MAKLIIGLIAAAGLTGMTAGALAAGGPGDGPGRGFERLDANDDGVLTEADFEQIDEKRAARRAERFEEADSDNNGVVTEEEWRAHREAKRAERNPDKNGDGQVDRTEFIQAAGDRFERLDTDGDGVLSEDELRHGRKFHRGGKRR